jgi:pimeloyl-ACP methyl ester carboxylesterase
MLSTAIEECWATIDGVRMRYLRSGSGRVLVLLHGLLGYSFSWRFSIPALARKLTVIAPDMPGAGFSESSANLDVSFRASAERLLRFLEAIGVHEFDLLGTSHGGAVAMMAAALVQRRSNLLLRKLILVAPVNPWSKHGQRLSRILTAGAVSSLFLLFAPHLPLAHRIALRRLYGDPRRISPGTLEGYSAPFEAVATFNYPLKILRTWNDDLRELTDLLPQIADVPTLVMWGTRDAAVDPASAEILCRNFRNCRLTRFKGVGHLPYEEVPDEFNQALLSFLSE